jgi:hypothetical protein
MYRQQKKDNVQKQTAIGIIHIQQMKDYVQTQTAVGTIAEVGSWEN